jgi:hypothetical protein
LGIDFIPESTVWPEDFWHDLIVSYHGSWNRSVPTGYKLVRVKLDAKGNYGGAEDFITGWLDKGRSLGRPVDVLVGPNGVIYASDDKAGVIYKIQYRPTAEDKSDLIKVNNIKAGDVIKSPLTVEGQARGNWFFEASFPIRVMDANGKELGVGIAQAQGEWMTTEFVPFKVQVSFSQPTTDTGTLILEKDNPSGLLEHDDQFVIPIKFK